MRGAPAPVAAARVSAPPWVRDLIDEILAAPGQPPVKTPDQADRPEASPDGWSGGTDHAPSFQEARAADRPPPRLGRWVDAWSIALLAIMLTVAVIALFATGR